VRNLWHVWILQKTLSECLLHFFFPKSWDLEAAKCRMTERKKNWDVATISGVARMLSVLTSSQHRGPSCQCLVTWPVCLSRAAQSRTLCTYLGLPHSADTITSFTNIITCIIITISGGPNVHTYIQSWLEAGITFRLVLWSRVGNHSGPSLWLWRQVGTEPSPVGGPGRQYIRTVILVTNRWMSPNLSELGALSAGCQAGLPVDS